jgi:hypothetical protein
MLNSGDFSLYKRIKFDMNGFYLICQEIIEKNYKIPKSILIYNSKHFQRYVFDHVKSIF